MVEAVSFGTEVKERRMALGLTQAELGRRVSCAAITVRKIEVVHRDLTPANILLDGDGNAYLSDFGIARQVGDEERVFATILALGLVLGWLVVGWYGAPFWSAVALTLALLLVPATQKWRADRRDLSAGRSRRRVGSSRR